VEVSTLRGLVTYYALFLIHLKSRKVKVVSITLHSNKAWMQQIARNVTMEGWGFLEIRTCLIGDRDTKLMDAFCTIVRFGHATPIKLTVRSSNLNAFAKR